MLKVECQKNVITVDGDLKVFDDFEQIRECLDRLKGYKSIILKLLNSKNITSSLLGYLYKLKEKDNIAVEVVVKNDELFELLDDLNINFEIKKLDE